MTLWQQWELVNYIANKDYGGNLITPDQFNELIKVVNIDLLKVKFGLPEEYQAGAPLSRQSLDLTQRLTDETRFLYTTEYNAAAIPGGIGFDSVNYPPDYFTLNSILYNYQRTIDGQPEVVPKKVEILTESEASDRLGNWTKRPTATNPIAICGRVGINIYPPNTINEVQLSYISYPIEPVFAYTVNTGYITYDAAGSTEYGWPEHLHMDLTRMILSYIGINMREQQLEQYAEQHKAQGV